MPPHSDPGQGLGFLLADVSRLLRRDFDRRVRDLGLTQAQWRAIAHLAREDGLKQVELAERLEVKPITLARLIDRMEAAGWVTRAADPRDRRATLLSLTGKAQPILERIRAHADEALAALTAGISAHEKRALLEALARMKQNLSETAAAAADPHTDTRTKDHVG